MGYRSTLFFKCTNDVLPELYATVVKADLQDSIYDFVQDDTYTCFTLSDLKWYDSYADVQLVNSKLAELGANNQATMIREGEEPGDIEIYGANPYALHLYYSMVLKFNGFGYGNDALPILQKSHPELFI